MVAGMGKSVQSMTLQQLRVELDRTRPAWVAELPDWGGALADGQLPASSQDAQRHLLVVNELLRRPSVG